jgi:hypothetical protein
MLTRILHNSERLCAFFDQLELNLGFPQFWNKKQRTVASNCICYSTRGNFQVDSTFSKYPTASVERNRFQHKIQH